MPEVPARLRHQFLLAPNGRHSSDLQGLDLLHRLRATAGRPLRLLPVWI